MTAMDQTELSEHIDPIELMRDVSAYNSQFNHDASDRMQFLGQGELPPPASCFVCGSGNNEAGYLNFGVWAEYVGNLLVCATCLIQGAEKAGCVAPSVRSLFEDNIRGLQARVNELTSELDIANEQLGAYRTIHPNANPVTDARVSGDMVSEGTGPTAINNSVVVESVKGDQPKRIAEITSQHISEDDTKLL